MLIKFATGDTTEYRVRHEDGCVLVFGSVPADALSKLAMLCPSRQAVLDPDLARMAGANLAFGKSTDCAKLRAKLMSAAKQRTAQQHAKDNLSPAAIEWLASGERGISSETMFEHLTGVKLRDGSRSHPWDPADLRRCRLLLEACPELAKRIGEMATLSPKWAALVACWDELCALMDEESPKWRNGKGKAVRTYALMSSILS